MSKKIKGSYLLNAVGVALVFALTAEQLNAIIGHIPLDDEDCKEPIKAAVLRALHDKYGMVEEDLLLAARHGHGLPVRRQCRSDHRDRETHGQARSSRRQRSSALCPGWTSTAQRGG